MSIGRKVCKPPLRAADFGLVKWMVLG
jgi:hypothetical protein